jgi:DNA-directed RNA polymerase sigma subunit (sigma70/sigma32)
MMILRAHSAPAEPVYLRGMDVHCDDVGELELDEILAQGTTFFEEPKTELVYRGGDDDVYDDPVKVYLREVCKVNKPSLEKERELAQKIHLGTDEAEIARKDLVEAHLGQVVLMAQRMPDRGHHLLDLIQAGNDGLREAVKHFDYRRGFRFSTYATWWIYKTLARL